MAQITSATRHNLSFEAYCKKSAELIEAAGRHLDAAKVEAAVSHVVKAIRSEQPVLVCGNGGSAADAMHITGELVGRFLIERKALSIICLTSNAAFITAWANDYDYETVFSRQVEAYGRSGGVIIGLSTSGNSVNVLRAFDAAQKLNMTTIALTGEGGGKLAAKSNILLDAPSRSTPLVQQVHICIYHYLCQRIEEQCS
jgi:D-sedoheptulose 7-phosphate isomerase